MTRNEFLRELETVIDAPANSVRGDEPLKDLGGWDSMAYLTFIVMADQKIGQPVYTKQLAACETVADLIALFPGKVS
jgi:acyl carrier protein